SGREHRGAGDDIAAGQLGDEQSEQADEGAGIDETGDRREHARHPARRIDLRNTRGPPHGGVSLSSFRQGGKTIAVPMTARIPPSATSARRATNSVVMLSWSL